jgi:hypothetical protein
VLTNRPAGKSSAYWSFAGLGAAIGLSAATLTSAYAGAGMLSCVGGVRSLNCAAQWGAGGDAHVRAVPRGLDEAEKAQSATRERRWLIRCEPVIERDAYGVARYQYAAPGCEYGVGAD